MASLEEEIKKRLTFAIISHPDAGKTTLTEKLLLLGLQQKAIQPTLECLISLLNGMIGLGTSYCPKSVNTYKKLPQTKGKMAITFPFINTYIMALAVRLWSSIWLAPCWS